jgi:hypothetical protein
VAIEDLAEDYGDIATTVAKYGIETNVLREIVKGVRGPKKRFVRFRVDRERLLRGQLAPVGDEPTDAFWAALERKFPGESAP